MGAAVTTEPVSPADPSTGAGVGRTRRRAPGGDRLAVAALVVLPLLVFAVPALVGHPVVFGDDATQNEPLRALVGRQLRAGHLPFSDPYIWSGAPLLGGWNAGAAYPLTWLFALLPATAAWTANLVATWWVAGLGTFAFLRRQRLRPVPSFLGALSFAYAGAFIAQIPHFGLVAGMSWLPLLLIAVDRLATAADGAGRARAAAGVAVCVALVCLAGEPRAIDDVGAVAVCYAAWRWWRSGRRPVVAGWLAGGAVAGACLAAVQLLPGLAAVSTSQRAGGGAALFASGSLPTRWLVLLLAPAVLGGSGSLHAPAFFASYNLTEVTGYVGLAPLAATGGLLASWRRGRGVPDWVVWPVVAAVGVVLALGADSPAGHLLVHLPLFGDQRLQSRNILVTDFALAVLLAVGTDRWLEGRLGRRAAVGATVAPAAAAGVALAGVLGGDRLWRWLGVSGPALGSVAGIRPWLVVPLAVAAAVGVAVWLGAGRLGGWAGRVAVAVVVGDVVLFLLTAVVAVAATPGPAVAAAGPAPPRVAGSTQAVPVGRLGLGGRFAIYDPDLLDGSALTAVGTPDLNTAQGSFSVEGYGSVVDGRYAAATGVHQATGEGQDVVAPAAVGDGTLEPLGDGVLLVAAPYLAVPTGGPPAPVASDPAAGRRRIGSGGSVTWALGGERAVTDVRATVTGATTGPLTVGCVPAGGSAGPTVTASVAAGALHAVFPDRPWCVALTLRGPPGLAVGDPRVDGPSGAAVLDGQLSAAVVPPRWRFWGADGPFAVYVDAHAAPPVRASGRPARVRVVTGPRWSPTVVAVNSTGGTELVRADAAIAGWSATWRPAGGPARPLVVRADGLVQAVRVPPGRGTVTWTYTPPHWDAAVGLSAAGVAAVAAVALVTRRRRRRTGPAEGRQ